MTSCTVAGNEASGDVSSTFQRLPKLLIPFIHRPAGVRPSSSRLPSAPLACSLSAVGVLAFCTQGGGLYILGTATLTSCTISGNRADDYVSARLLKNLLPKTYFHRPVGVLAFCSQGGGLRISGTATLTSCTISGNQADKRVSACLSTFETLLPSPRWSTDPLAIFGAQYGSVRPARFFNLRKPSSITPLACSL